MCHHLVWSFHFDSIVFVVPFRERRPACSDSTDEHGGVLRVLRHKLFIWYIRWAKLSIVHILECTVHCHRMPVFLLQVNFNHSLQLSAAHPSLTHSHTHQHRRHPSIFAHTWNVILHLMLVESDQSVCYSSCLARKETTRTLYIISIHWLVVASFHHWMCQFILEYNIAIKSVSKQNTSSFLLGIKNGLHIGFSR